MIFYFLSAGCKRGGHYRGRRRFCGQPRLPAGLLSWPRPTRGCRCVPGSLKIWPHSYNCSWPPSLTLPYPRLSVRSPKIFLDSHNRSWPTSLTSPYPRLPVCSPKICLDSHTGSWPPYLTSPYPRLSVCSIKICLDSHTQSWPPSVT